MERNRLPGDARPVPDIEQDYPLLHPHLARLLAAPDCYFEAGFAAFVCRLEEAFSLEEGATESGVESPDARSFGVGASAFRSLQQKRELHAEVLHLLHHARARNLAGDYALARKVIRLLPQWLNAQVLPIGLPEKFRSPEVRAAGKTAPVNTSA